MQLRHSNACMSCKLLCEPGSSAFIHVDVFEPKYGVCQFVARALGIAVTSCKQWSRPPDAVQFESLLQVLAVKHPAK